MSTVDLPPVFVFGYTNNQLEVVGSQEVEGNGSRW